MGLSLSIRMCVRASAPLYVSDCVCTRARVCGKGVTPLEPVFKPMTPQHRIQYLEHSAASDVSSM